MIIGSLFDGSGFRMPEKKPVFVEKWYSKQYSRPARLRDNG